MANKNQLNNIEKIFCESNNIKDFASGHFAYLQTILNRIDLDSLGRLVKEFEDARNDNKTIFVGGNGGWAAKAITMANDIGFHINNKTGIDEPYRILALTDNTSVITAIAIVVIHISLITKLC